jgi:hypothetical protein
MFEPMYAVAGGSSDDLDYGPRCLRSLDQASRASEQDRPTPITKTVRNVMDCYRQVFRVAVLGRLRKDLGKGTRPIVTIVRLTFPRAERGYSERATRHDQPCRILSEWHIRP